MKAILLHATGGPEQLQLSDVPAGEPGPGEVRIRHHAVGLNFIDVYHRTGLYPLPLPHGLGVEGAGVIEAVGTGVQHLAVGDRAAYAGGTPGAYAEARVLPAMNVCQLPDDVAFDIAAGAMLKGLTVQYLLKKTLPQGGLHPGDFVLWHAAAGGVGLMACQWARHLGLRLIATAGSDEKCALAMAHGAEFAINYRTAAFAPQVRQITQGRGVKAVYDSVGRDTFEGSLDCLSPLGLMASFGNASGPVAPFAPSLLAAKGGLYLTRPTLAHHTTSRQATQAMADDLFAVLQAGVVQVRVAQRYPLDEVQQAHRDLEARLTTGSAVLLP